MGGTNIAEGRVEICLRNEWGTVCDQMWDTADSGVVCRQLGFASAGNLGILYKEWTIIVSQILCRCRSTDSVWSGNREDMARQCPVYRE